MSKSLYEWVLAYLQSDGKCEWCTFDRCARFPEALFCPYMGTGMRGTKKMWWYFTDAEQMTRKDSDTGQTGHEANGTERGSS